MNKFYLKIVFERQIQYGKPKTIPKLLNHGDDLINECMNELMNVTFVVKFYTHRKLFNTHNQN